MNDPNTRHLRLNVTGTGATIDAALAAAYTQARLGIEAEATRLFGDVKTRGWYIGGHAIDLTHRETRLAGSTLHTMDAETLVFTVAGDADITVRIFAATPTTTPPRPRT